MTDNVAINFAVYKLPGNSDTPTLVLQTTRTVEVAVTTRAVNNFAQTPTSTVFAKGDRIAVVIQIDDSTASMNSGGTCWIGIGGGTAGVDGDTYITFTETFGFLTTAPSGSTYYLHKAAETVNVTDRDSLSMTTSRGSTVATTWASFNSPSTTPGVTGDCDFVTYEVPIRTQWERVITTGTTSDVLDDITTTSHWNAQGFKIPTGAGTILRKTFVNCAVIGPDEDMVMDIRTDSAGQPAATADVDTSNGTGYGPLLHFVFNTPFTTLSEATQYWAVVRETNGGTYQVNTNGWTTGTYADGVYSRSSNGGSSWTGTSKDMSLELYLGKHAEFYTPALAAQTLSGLVKFNIRAYAGSTYSMWAELAVCNEDGTGATVWANSSHNSTALGRVTTSDVAYTMWFCGDDLSISANQRIRLRLRTTGDHATGTLSSQSSYGAFSIDGPSASAAGDSWLQFSQTITEASGGGATQDPYPYLTSGGYYPTQG
jgi:hypothetical protein